MTPTEATRTWLTDFVIKHNLCPFAATPFKNNLIRFAESDETEHGKITTFIESELELIKSSSPTELATLEFADSVQRLTSTPLYLFWCFVAKTFSRSII
jgi:hypothetical protein